MDEGGGARGRSWGRRTIRCSAAAFVCVCEINNSFCVNFCLAIVQQELLFSPGFGALNAYLPKSPSSEQCFFNHAHAPV